MFCSRVSNLDKMKDMAQLYLADADEEDEDGGCLELRKLWMGDGRIWRPNERAS